jgi:CheY-like chemotaxis protein
VRATKVILLAEDSESDLMLMRFAFEKAKVKRPIQVAQDGQEAVDYLSGTGIYANRKKYPEVCVLITDVKMPRMDGFELLAWLNERPEYVRLPRIVLSASGLEEDRRRAAELGSCAYFVKPSELNELIEVVAHLDEKWISEHCPMAKH